MGTLFGTDGIRGVANQHPMDAMMAFSVGQAITHVLKREGHRTRIIIGKDTRISGYMLESALLSGITSMGGDPYLVGVLPTPGIAFITESMRADAGIVISASHNPYQDNGIKIFGGNGYKLSDEQEGVIEELILNGNLPKKVPPAHQMGQAHVDIIHNTPNGININDKCGSQHTQDLRKRVVEQGAAIGLAFDGDGDRLIAVDEKGREITGDQILIICSRMLKEQGRLKNDLLVSTIMSNLGLTVACKKYGFKHHAAKVGDRYVLEDMQRLGGAIGGEESGHVIFLDHHTTGDGILTALQLIAAMLAAGKPLSELAQLMDIFPQKLINVNVSSKPEISTLPQVVAAIKEVEAALGDQGRVLVRYSGTQNMCRVMVEGPTDEVTAKYCQQIVDAVQAAIG